MRKDQKSSYGIMKRGSLLLLLVGMLALTGCGGGQKGGLTEFTGNGNSDVDGAAGDDDASSDAARGDDVQNRDNAKADGADSIGADSSDAASGDDAKADGTDSTSKGEKQRTAVPAPDFALSDQNGEIHTLSDYKGKVVFLNFWATWCGPCQMEMPDIQDVYEEYGENTGDLVVLGVANPSTEEKPYNNDVSAEEIGAFLAEGGYTYPTVMDETGEILSWYGIQAFPTTFMIDKDGNVFGYVNGMLSREMIDDIIRQTMEAEPAVAEPEENAGQSGTE